jgi:hypothetical protein
VDDLRTQGWGTADSAQVMALLRPFGSVTVLNDMSQVLQKVEAMSPSTPRYRSPIRSPRQGRQALASPGP